MPAPEIVHQLVKRFEDNLESYKQIDRLVYEFYGLTEEEIKIVEG